MVFHMSDTCRERARRLLNTTPETLTAAAVADHLGTTVNRAGVVLRELEQQGAATRQRGAMSHYGRIPDQWTAGRP